MRACLRSYSFLALLVPSAASSQVGGPMAFHGTRVTPLGEATVAISPTTGQLVVGNIGSSGEDGFTLLTAVVHGGRLAWSAAAPVSGRAIRVEATTNLPGIVPCIDLTTDAGGGTEILPDFSSTGADGHIVEVLLTGTPVGQTFIPLGASLMCDAEPVSVGADMHGALVSGASPPIALFAPVPMLRVTTGVPATFEGPGGPIGFGDELRVFPSNAGSTADELQKLVVLCSVPTGSEPYAMTFDDCAQLIHGREHRGTMFGLIEKDFDGEIKFNFSVPPGASGGLQIDMHRSDTGKNVIQNLKFADAGDTDAFSVTGERFDGLVAELGRVSGVCDGASWSLAPDFSGSGSSGTLVQLYNLNDPALSSPWLVTGDILVGSNAFPTEMGVDDRNGLAIAYGYASPVAVTLPEGTFIATRIVMASNAPVAHEYFTHVDREVSSAAGVSFGILGEPNGLRVPEGEFHCFAAVAGQFLRNMDACPCVEAVDLGDVNGGDFIFEPFVPGDQFGIEWLNDATPGPAPGETDWDFISRLATDETPVARMGIRMVSDGAAVALYAVARQTPKSDFGSVLKTGTTTVMEYVHSSETEPFAVLPQWPIAAGYQVLHYPDRTWSMWINLGQPMDIVIPGNPPADNTAATARVVTADFIHLVFLDTPIASPVVESMLVTRTYDKSHRLFFGKKTRAVSVGPLSSWHGPTLRAPYPNPFNPSTTLAFDLSTGGDVTVRIYTVRGHHVATLHSGPLAAGPHTMTWDGVDHRGRRAASGVYLVELRAPDGTSHAKLNLVK